MTPNTLSMAPRSRFSAAINATSTRLFGTSHLRVVRARRRPCGDQASAISGRAEAIRDAMSVARPTRCASTARSATLNCCSPVCRVPSTSPGPRSLRSSSAIRNPSCVSRIDFQAACATLHAERRFVEQNAMAALLAAPDAAAQLMQLRESEPLGVLDDHQRRVRHVHADLDDRGCYEQMRSRRT